MKKVALYCLLLIILTTFLLFNSCGGGGGGGGSSAGASLPDSEYTTHNPGGWGGGGSGGGSSGGSNNEGSGPEVTVQGSTPLNVTGYIFNSITYTSVEELTRAMLAANAGGNFEITFMVAGETSARTAKVSRTDKGYNIDLQYKATCTTNTASETIWYYSNSGINLSSLNESGITGWQVSGGSTYTGSLITGIKGDVTIMAIYDVAPVPAGMLYVAGGNDSNGNTIPNLYVCDHEVTQYEYVMNYTSTPAGARCGYGGTEPSDQYGLGTNYPAYYVSWYDAVIYCNLRSMAEGKQPCYSRGGDTDPKNWTGIGTASNGGICGPSSTMNISVDTSKNGYRLPTEPEWQWAANGGVAPVPYDYAGSDNIGDVAWFGGNSGDNGGSHTNGGKSHVVKTKAANTLGIYDMSGNVWEWCWDSISSTNRVYRGGSWEVSQNQCTVSYRVYKSPAYRYYAAGFRVVRNAP